MSTNISALVHWRPRHHAVVKVRTGGTLPGGHGGRQAGSVPATQAPPEKSRPFTWLIALSGVAVFLQGLWAGIFIREAMVNNGDWVAVHARDARMALRWCAAGMIEAGKKFRRVNAHL